MASEVIAAKLSIFDLFVLCDHSCFHPTVHVSEQKWETASQVAT